MVYALDLYASHESSGDPIFADLWDSRPFKYFTGKAGQNEITKFHQKSEFLMIFEIYFYICTVDWWSQISALQVGIGQIVKF